MSLREIATDLIGAFLEVIEVRVLHGDRVRFGDAPRCDERVTHAGYVRVAYADDRGVLVLWLETPTGDIVQAFAADFGGFGEAKIKLRRATAPIDETADIITQLARLRCQRFSLASGDLRSCREALPEDKASLCCLPCRAYLVVHAKDDSPRT